MNPRRFMTISRKSGARLPQANIGRHLVYDAPMPDDVPTEAKCSRPGLDAEKRLHEVPWYRPGIRAKCRSRSLSDSELRHSAAGIALSL